MKKSVLSCFLLLFSVLVFAQEFEVPDNYTLNTDEDYDKYEQDVVRCFNWLLATPLGNEPNKRKDSNAFLMKWLMGSSKVHIEIKPEIVTFMNTSPELLMIFMGGWATHSLTSQDFDNKVAGSLAGLESVMNFYTQNKPVLGKIKEVEKYIKLKSKGKLKRYVAKNA